MRLRHWSAIPLGEIRSVQPGHRDGIPSSSGKPVGLWLSDDSGDDGWKAWCEAEDFRPNGFAHHADFDVDLTAVKHLKSEDEILEFSTEFTLKNPKERYQRKAIDWPLVGTQYKGILITPYCYELRFDLMWYYSWDCASGCFWDVSCLERVERPCEREER